MSTLSTTVRRGLVVTAAAVAAGPVAAGVANAATTGPTTAAPLDTAPITNIIEPAAGTVANGATQYADALPVGRMAPAPSLGALPVAGPLAQNLPLVGPVSNMAMPVLSGVTGGLPLVGPLVQGLPLVGPMISPAHAVTVPLTRSRSVAHPTGVAQGTARTGAATGDTGTAATGQSTTALRENAPMVMPPALPIINPPALPSVNPAQLVNPAPSAAPSLPLLGALPLGNLPLVGSLTNLLHF